MFFCSLRVFYKGATKSKELFTKDFIRLVEQILDMFYTASFNSCCVKSKSNSS